MGPKTSPFRCIFFLDGVREPSKQKVGSSCWPGHPGRLPNKNRHAAWLNHGDTSKDSVWGQSQLVTGAIVATLKPGEPPSEHSPAGARNDGEGRGRGRREAPKLLNLELGTQRARVRSGTLRPQRRVGHPLPIHLHPQM